MESYSKDITIKHIFATTSRKKNIFSMLTFCSLLHSTNIVFLYHRGTCVIVAYSGAFAQKFISRYLNLSHLLSFRVTLHSIKLLKINSEYKIQMKIDEHIIINVI